MQINSNLGLVQQFFAYLQFRFLLKNLKRSNNFLRYFKSRSFQRIGVYGEMIGIAKGEHLGAKCYHLRVRPLNDSEEIIIVVEEYDYIQQCCKELNVYFEKKSAEKMQKEIFFANLSPGFDNNRTIKYLVNTDTQILAVSEQFKAQVLRRLADVFRSQPTTEVSLTSENISVEGGLISLGDLRLLVMKACKTREVICGIVQIVRQSQQRFNDLYKTSYDTLVHQLIHVQDEPKVATFRLLLDVIHPNEQAEQRNRLINWHSYAFFNPEAIIGQFLDVKYQIKVKENRPGDNTSQFYLLEERDQPQVLILRNKALKISRISDIPTAAYTRDIYKIRVIVNQLELLIARVICKKCRRIRISERCELCGCEEFELDLWAQCLAQDFNSCAYLNLNTDAVVDFYNLNEEHLQLIQRLTLKCSDTKLIVPGMPGKRPNRELIPLYQHLKPLMESRLVLVTPFIDMHKTFRKTMTHDQAVDLEIGFKTERQFHETLRVFPNGTAVGTAIVPSLRVVQVLPRQQSFFKLQ